MARYVSFFDLPVRESLPAIPAKAVSARNGTQKERAKLHADLLRAEGARVRSEQEACQAWKPAKRGRKHRAGKRKQALKATATRKRIVRAWLARRLRIPFRWRENVDAFSLRAGTRVYLERRKGKIRIGLRLAAGQCRPGTDTDRSSVRVRTFHDPLHGADPVKGSAHFVSVAGPYFLRVPFLATVA